MRRAKFNDPRFSWSRVPGAARYELEINFSADFATGSRVCCSSPTIATEYTPLQLLDNNRYYWRVRAYDANGNQGPWAYPSQVGQAQAASPPGLPYDKNFDNALAPEPNNVTPPSIKGLHMRTNLGDSGSSGPGFATDSPIAVWQPVVGASAYEVNVARYELSSGTCLWSSPGGFPTMTTANTDWTPFGAGSKASPPYPARNVTVAGDGTSLVSNQHYCIRVRPLGDNSRKGRVYGDYTELRDAFAFTRYQSGDNHAPAPVAYGGPVATGSSAENATPLFTWQAEPGASAYWVLVSRDPSFTNLVDYAFTQIPAYAPRRTYADETTAYYWAVLPSTSRARNGGDPVIAYPTQADPKAFDKQSDPPEIVAPADGAKIGLGGYEQLTFRWRPARGARSYHLQVSTDPKFRAGIIDDVTTDSTAYTSETTYPAGVPLYWRVQALDESKIGLTWSCVRDRSDPSRCLFDKDGNGRFYGFERELPAPQPLAVRPAASEQPPTLHWTWLPGAVSYDLQIFLANNSVQEVDGLPTPSFVVGAVAGLGNFLWRVRAEFPKKDRGTIPGPFSRKLGFTRKLGPPNGAHASTRGGIVFGWAPKLGARSYQVQVSRVPDFTRSFDSASVDTPVYAPTLRSGEYARGGIFYWHVAAAGADGNVGKFGRTMVLQLPPGG